jgi:V8-like Glu-specific endopeptidase
MTQDICGLLSDCTVRIKNKSTHKQHDGSGFFVGQNLILTCAHVVRGLREGDYVEEIYIMATGDTYRGKLQRIFFEEYIDLAILEIEGERINHPCVYLGKPWLDPKSKCDLHTFGYPINSPDGDTVPFKYQGTSYRGKTYLWHRLTDAHVEPGLSGSPVLHISTGLVCGVISIHHNNNAKPYSRAISTESIFYSFPDLERLRAEFHSKDQRWHNLIPDLNLKEKVEGVVGNTDYCKSYILDILRDTHAEGSKNLIKELYEKYSLEFIDVLESLLDRSCAPSSYEEREQLVIQTASLIGNCKESILILYRILDNPDSRVGNRIKAKNMINSLREVNLMSIMKEWVKQIGYPIRFPTDQDIIPPMKRIREFRIFLSNEQISDLLQDQNSVALMSSFLVDNGRPPILENSLYLFLGIQDKDFHTLIRNSSLKERFIKHEKEWVEES